MNKKLLELLDSINEKKAIVKNLVDAGKIEEAKAAKSELVALQDEFDLLKDMDDEPVVPANKKPLPTQTKMTSEQMFANAARNGFRNKMNEGTGADGGYTVPEDIQTKINTYRDAQFSLQQLVTVENVKTEAGARTYKTKAQKTGFQKIGEGAKVQKADLPKFERITYKIEKYGGYLPITNELLADSDANITNFVSQWMADESRVTRNKLILEELKAAKSNKYTVIKTIDDITKALNVTLGAAYRGTAKIITNDNGLQELQMLKDGNGRPLLNPNPADPMKMQISAGANVIPVVVLPNSDFPNVKDTNDYAPIIIGDLKEAVTLFDRNKMSLKMSDTASVTGFNAFEEDLTLIRGLEREDVVVKDKNAYVYGRFNTQITE